MKILALGICVLILSSCKEDSNFVGQRTTLEVKQVYDAGNILKGEIIRAKFKVKNTGSSPLIFGSVSGGCTCTVGNYTKEPIAPGAYGMVELEIDTKKVQLGDMRKDATIIANTNPSATKIGVKANITSN